MAISTSSLGSGGKFTDPCSGVPPVPASRAFSCAALRAVNAANKAVVRSTEGPSAVPPSALTEGGAAGGPSGDRTTALLEALTARRAAQEKAREAGAGGTPEQGSVNLPPDPRDDVMIALLELQKLLQEEIQEMRKKMGGKEGQGDNSKRQDSHKSGSWKSRSSKRRRREEESDRSSSESRSGESSSSSQSTDFTPPKEKKRYPFVDRIMDVVMPKLRTPTQLKHYDRASDPVAHVNSFKAAMLYAGAPDEVMCRAFPSTPDGDAQLWFSDLPSGSISSFKQLSKRFTSYFATSRTIKRTAHCLKNVVQGKEESLKDFLIRFTKAARQIQGLKMEVALSYLTDNLRSKLFCCSITKKPPKTMAELLARSTKYIAFEEVQQAKEGGNPRRRKPSLPGAEAKDIGGMIGEKIGGMIGTEGNGDRSLPGRSGPDSAHGSSGKNGSGVGVTILTLEGIAVEQALQLNFKTTNNQAEYEALIAGLRLAKELGAKQATVHNDSQLVAGQLNGTFDVKEPTIARYVDLTRRLMAQFQKVVVERMTEECR
ncbi:uncharacterized protein G2W53_004625 [Senna tora]|uniref:RNase H type-1 domain-containing protein n=1 Tax=Senna tora TaxID=362788 RepID=A0A835CKE8_9FABA|nr:uncharacterized protein G2W53_004625 [Senna tora]